MTVFAFSFLRLFDFQYQGNIFAIGHEYQSTISHRLNGCNCLYCSNRKVQKGYNDIATTHPELIKDWNYEKNTFSPYEIVAGTPKKIWWKCNKCGYEWQASGDNRTRVGWGCPCCSGKIVQSGVISAWKQEMRRADLRSGDGFEVSSFFEKGHFWFENKILIWYNKSVNGITKERAVNGVGKV